MKNTDKSKSPIKRLYTIYDNVARLYAPPFLASGHCEAVRTFRSIAESDNTVMGKNLDHFILTWLGDFDSDDAQVDILTDGPVTICSAYDAVNDYQSLMTDLQRQETLIV